MVDVFLRSVPSDANRNDVRLYNPLLPDSGGTPINYTVVCDPGVFNFTGAARDFKTGRFVVASPGAFAFTGAARDFRTRRFVPLAAGSFAFTGAAKNFKTSRSIVLESGQFNLTGSDIQVQKLRALYRGKWVVS